MIQAQGIVELDKAEDMNVGEAPPEKIDLEQGVVAQVTPLTQGYEAEIMTAQIDTPVNESVMNYQFS